MMLEDADIEVRRITELPADLSDLINDAVLDGFDGMSLLQAQWNSGVNQFTRPGEILALATINGELAGIGGITQDFVDSSWLRMRRFYVRPAYRRRGVGQAIAQFVLNYAKPLNRQIVLYAAGKTAELFWPTLGFVPIDRENTTHILDRGHIEADK
uniref:N-acetyltransferase domain-containing protein n=1 Tax=Panagrolaimus sp. ES5 TaxID=591445 RepID=A0AC34G3P4_9BILA